MNTPDTEWREKVRDWWYRVQDDCSGMMHSLPEARRVEIEHIIKEAISSRDTYWKEQLQNARIEWLRSEIEKLEGMRQPGEEQWNWQRHYNEAITDIITRYREELKVLESK